MIAGVFIALIAFCNAQQLLDLKSFPGNADKTIDATGPYSIYVSASSDDDALLKQINVKNTGNQIKSLYDLKTNKLYQNSGLLQPFKIDTTAVISTTLSNDQMGTLKGYLYITTANQLQNNKGFYVYNVETSEQIKITNLLPDDCTIVFLNTNYKITPWQSSTVSAWSQKEGSSVYLYEGIPKDTDEKKNSHIFSNPVYLSNGNTMFIPTVDIFSLNLGAFYFKTHKGVQFVIESQFNDVNDSHTSSKTTTGFYMKPFNSVDKKITINTGHDDRYNGTTGVNVVGNVPQNADFIVSGPGNWTTNPSNVIQGWNAAVIADSLTFQTVNSVAGEVFVQYYIIQGTQSMSTTTMLPGRQTTARGMESTTKSTAMLQLFTSILIPILGAKLL